MSPLDITLLCVLGVPVLWLLVGLVVYIAARVIHGTPDKDLREQIPLFDLWVMVLWPYTLYKLVTDRKTARPSKCKEHVFLRNMLESDLPWVLSLERSCFPEGDAWSAQEFLREDCEQFSWVITLGFGGTPAGYMVFDIGENESVHITNLAVLPKFRGQGIATELLERFQDAWKSVKLEVRESNEAARKLYDKLGFKTVGRHENLYVNPVEDGILMEYSK